MAKACMTCKGLGRWAEEIADSSSVEVVWHFCNDCSGTGVSQDEEDGEDYDIGGDSYADES